MARQGVGNPDQSEDISKRAEQELLGSPAGVERDDPARKIAVTHPVEARRFYHRGEGILCWKGPNALREIAVGLVVPNDDATHDRQQLE